MTKMPDKKVNVTHGESLFIARSLKLLRNDIKQEIQMHGDDSGISDSHVRVLDKIIPKFDKENSDG
jgi:hypothetical protein